MTVTQLLLAVLLIPLLSAGLIALFCRQRGGLASALSVLAAAAILTASLMAVRDAPEVVLNPFQNWLSFGEFRVSMGLLFNDTSMTMLLMVTFIGFLIHVFSLGYMADDAARARFFGGLSIFMFSMSGIVLADNLIMIFVFWELVGFSSYMLIGHYLDTDEAAAASKKAFIVNRIGDLGFLVGIVYAYWHFGTTDLSAIEESVSYNPELVKASIAALLMCGFIGKSAQFPLHVWLPDAMAGPTPVSALIHAATMVAAGIYFLIRIEFLFPDEVLTWIAWLGTSVAVYAGFCAYGQNDIKKVLAYSTLSQLGYMSAAFGLGYPGIAFFHLITHACFKALLFLSAGSVIHACHHEQDIFKMGGLLRKMPVTGITFLIGTLALCGVYGFSGFFSKDAILIAGGFENGPIFILLTLGAFMTAGYMGRLFWVAFLGSANSDNAMHAKESSFTMWMPLVVLAVLSVAGAYWPEKLGLIVTNDLDRLHHMSGYGAMHMKVLIIGSAAWITGLVLSFLFYKPGAKKDRLEERASPVYHFLKSRLWLDEIYNFYVAKVQQPSASFLNLIDVFVIKGIIVRGSGGLVGLMGICARSLHNGSIHTYVYWFLAGLLLAWAVASGGFYN